MKVYELKDAVYNTVLETFRTEKEAIDAVPEYEELVHVMVIDERKVGFIEWLVLWATDQI